MFIELVLFSLMIHLGLNQQYRDFIGGSSDILCSSEKQCTFIEYCPAISSLMDHQQLPIHRLRQAICGYESTRLKVCCDVNMNLMNPLYTQADGTFLRKSNTQFECGKNFVRSNGDTVGTYPFVARIGFSNSMGNIKYSCNGVIISNTMILTTAACALARSNTYKLHSVLIGEFNTDTNPDCNSLFCGRDAQCYNISYVIKHPSYRAATFANNIAILRLEKPIQFTATAQPVCLLPRGKYVNVDSMATLVGWGSLFSQREKTDKQQFLGMRVLSPEECASYYNEGFSVELCAIGNDIPCSGYNGSPLLARYGDTYYLLGLLSYGSSCDSRMNLPSVFVDVQKYTSWILENC